MSNIAGTNLAAAIAPFTTEDTYPTHYAEYGKGGWHSVATISDRDAIPVQRRETGMVVFVQADNTPYRLEADGTWKKMMNDIDSALSETSENPVQNKVIAEEFNSLKAEINTKIENHENAERAYHNEVVRVVNEAKAYMDDCAKYNQAICGFDGNNGVGLFDPTKTYNYGDLVAIKTDEQYTMYRCVVSSHTGAFSEADFVGTNMFQEYNRIYAGGANEMVTVVVTKDGTPISGKEVILNNITTGETQTATTDKEGVAMFGNLKDEDKVPYGELYTITAPAEEGCNIVPEGTFVANTPARTVKLAFISENPNYGYDIPVVTVYAYERQQIEYNNTAVEKALVGKQCSLLIDGKIVETVDFEGRSATFTKQIPTRTAYKVVLPNLEDSNLRIRSQEIDVVSAGVGLRNMTADYFMLHTNTGVVAISNTGETFNLTELQNKLDKMDKEGATEQDKQDFKDSILYIGISNEATQPADPTGIANHTGGLEASKATDDGKNGHVYSTTPKNCSFMFHIRQVSGQTYKNLMWQTTQVNVQNMPFVPTNVAGYLRDMDGNGRTAQMAQAGMSFPAMEWVTQEAGDILSPFDNAETLHAFMPASGQLYQMQLYKNDINELARLILNKSNDYNFNIFSGSWWSASHYTATYALSLSSGSMTYSNKSNAGNIAARFYEFA